MPPKHFVVEVIYLNIVSEDKSKSKQFFKFLIFAQLQSDSPQSFQASSEMDKMQQTRHDNALPK